MFGKRSDRKHRFVEGKPDDLSDAAQDEGENLELRTAFENLGRGAPVPWGRVESMSETTEAQDADADVGPREGDAESVTAAEIVDGASPESDAETEAMPEDVPAFGDDRPDAAMADAQAQIAVLTAELERVRSTNPFVELKAARNRAEELERMQVESKGRIDSLTADLKRVRAKSAVADDARAVAERAGSVDEAVLDLQSKVTSLTADLEQARSEAAAAGVALERAEREAKDHEAAVASAELGAEQLTAEMDKLRTESAKGPAQVERLKREAERERALRAAIDQIQASNARVEDVVADNLRLAADLTANLKNQEALVMALTGLQTEISEQRAWFESQLTTVRQMESEQVGALEGLQRAVQERDAELDVLRQHLLEAEAKRAEEAAAFIAALEQQV